MRALAWSLTGSRIPIRQNATFDAPQEVDDLVRTATLTAWLLRGLAVTMTWVPVSFASWTAYPSTGPPASLMKLAGLL